MKKKTDPGQFSQLCNTVTLKYLCQFANHVMLKSLFALDGDALDDISFVIETNC